MTIREEHAGVTAVEEHVSTRERIKREPPRRVAPRRDMGLAFRPQPAAAGAAGMGGAVEQGVQTAYQVIDAYIQRGRAEASRREPGAGAGGAMNNEVPFMAATAAQFWIQLAQMWLGSMAPVMSAAMPGMFGWNRSWDMGGPMPWGMQGMPFPQGMPGMQGMPFPQGTPFAQGTPSGAAQGWGGVRGGSSPPPEPPPASRSVAPPKEAPVPGAMPAPSVAKPEEGLALAVEVSSVHRTEVRVELLDKTATKHLVVRALHAIDDDGKPPLSGIRLEQVDGHLRVLVTVPPGHPTGVYAGVIIDKEKGRACGTLNVALRAHP